MSWDIIIKKCAKDEVSFRLKIITYCIRISDVIADMRSYLSWDHCVNHDDLFPSLVGQNGYVMMREHKAINGGGWRCPFLAPQSVGRHHC